MRVSDIIFTGFIIAIFIVPIEKYNFIYKLINKIILLNKIPIKNIPIIIKIIFSILITVLYLILDYTNKPTLLFNHLKNTIFYPISLSVLSPVTGEVLVAIVGLMFTILTLLYTGTTNLRKNDAEVIFKLVDLLENNIKVAKKEKVDSEINSIKKDSEDKDLRRIFLLTPIVKLS
ncbi:MAG: hypothetical protein ABS911_10450 [Carnobacterium sp.]|uniref:hypothetical protein n=1 Tax=Carnobacterium sp. TaxID=48221 RepID=UPI0033146327